MIYTSTNKKKSSIWTFFIECENPRLVECKLCFTKISLRGKGRQATTRMTNHINNKHKDEFCQLQVNSLSKKQNAAFFLSQDTFLCQTRKKDLKQLNLLECKKISLQWDINDVRAKEYHYLIGEMLAVDNESISMVEKPGFTRLKKDVITV